MSEPRSAYIHVPFCSHRCGYCNFTLVTGRDDLVPAYLEALEAELATTLEHPVSLDTIFLGGGTPSHLAPTDLERLLVILSKWLRLDPYGEFSCEANPLDCNHERLALLREGGVNRISLGGQSFNDKKLRRLERDHTGEELTLAIERCAEYFSNLSLDLIFAAPDETLSVWQSDVARAIEAPLQHLSTYGLTIERGSAFYGRALRHELAELHSELQLAMYEHAITALTSRNWEHYEVSSFAQPGFHCRHNETYWLGQPWLAFGPGAASFRHLPDGETFVRSVNHRSTTTYIRKQQAGESAVAESESLTLEAHVRERLVFGLRRLQGVRMSDLDIVWRGPVQPLFEPYLSRYIQQGWLRLEAGILRLTSEGLVISDSLWPDLLVGSEP